MAHETRYNDESKTIETHLTGLIKAEELFEIIRTCSELAKEYACYTWLNDFSSAEFEFSTFDIYHIPTEFLRATESLGPDRYKVKRAIVTQKVVDDHRFAETMAINSSQNVKAFTDIARAQSWLHESTIG